MRDYAPSFLAKTSRLILTALFLAALFLPMAASILYPKASRGLGEQAEILPDFTPGSPGPFVAALRAGWVERNFPFRGDLIRLDNHVSARMLSSSMLSPVALGKDGWLFLAKDQGRDLLEEHRSIVPLPQSALAAQAAEFEGRRAWLAQRGIRYLILVAPEKATVYPEHLPEGYAQTAGTPPLDQTLGYLRAHTGLDILDLRPAIFAAKREHQVFYRTDTHWNAYGAYAAYLAAVAKLQTIFPGIEAPTMRDYEIKTSVFSGDQAKLLGLDDSMKEDFIQFFPTAKPESEYIWDYRESPHYAKAAWASVRPDADLPSAVILHDSYYVEQFLYFPDHFRHGVYVWAERPEPGKFRFFDKDLIEQERPDIVIEEYTERYFRPAAPPKTSP